MLARLPETIEEALADLETLLAASQMDRCRDLLTALVQEIRLTPVLSTGQRQLEAELRGDMQRILYLAATRGPTIGKWKAVRWLGEEDSDGLHTPERRWVEVSLTA